MSILELRNLAKGYGKKSVLKDVSLTVEPGDFMVVYGMPTSGKSVLVRLLTGLETADRGQILLRGKDATLADAGQRNLGYVPQSFALYPHFSVRKNISYPLDLAGAPKEQIESQVKRASQLLGIEPLLDRRPDQLSGGQKQRVAIARGLVKQTDLFILDDPLVGLDFKLRERLIDDLKATQDALNVTFLYTTSDAVEAMMLARHIAVLDEGEIVEMGEPEALYLNPQRAQTMKYVSFPQANFLPATLAMSGSGVQVDSGVFKSSVDVSIEKLRKFGDLMGVGANNRVSIGIRPEHISIGENGFGSISTQAKVLLREDLGGEEIVYLDVKGKQLSTVLRHDAQHEGLLGSVAIDQTVTLSVKPQDIVLFVDGRQIGRGS